MVFKAPGDTVAAWERISMDLDRWNFDIGGALLGGKVVRLVDGGGWL